MGKVLKVREIGDICLEKICEEVDVNKKSELYITEIIDNLKETLKFGTSLGISAPQIGETKRIIVIGASKENIKYDDAQTIHITAMINPKWEKLSDETDIQYEGCSSVPIVRGKVERYKNIKTCYYDEDFIKIEKEVSGFFARLVQHECDHLEGMTFLERVNTKNGFATTEMIRKFSKK